MLVEVEFPVWLLTVPVELGETVDVPRSDDILSGVAWAGTNWLASVEVTEVIGLVLVDVG